MKYLSNATIEQLYFALRLASADLLYEDDGFPLFLDDVFGNYDDFQVAHHKYPNEFCGVECEESIEDLGIFGDQHG